MKLLNRAGKSSVWLLLLVFLFVLFSCSKDESSEKTGSKGDQAVSENSVNGPAPKISFPEISYDFGTINQGEIVSHTFVVKNTGDAPLELIRAKGS